ncbi:hypothetical protein KIH87_16720 [Paraneptunicella aestuarii]|uniref:lipase secretion chaperone n=1 Tax=Paraneptunicella aestuarii TaxID=2831148 RepID=UPI001E4BBF93|nr:lipase secretion chaperone [Paraneptunicella aestuarii]UAA38309.1 hypothetical protein KIH87_16720 [Paraneptunicella aestuarii]
MRKFVRRVWLPIVLLALVATGYWNFKPDESTSHERQTTKQMDANSNDAVSVSSEHKYIENPNQLIQGESKAYQLSAETLVLFDEIIAGNEERNQTLMLKALHEWAMQNGYDSEASDILQDVFTRYVQYKDALSEIKSLDHERIFSADHMSDVLYAMQQLRLDYFSAEEIQALFSEQNEYDEMALARLRIQQDKDLTPEQKQQLLQQNIAQLSESAREALQPSMEIRKLQTLKQEAKSLTKEQRLARLSAEYGEEAAQRLSATLDNADQWQQRVSDFKQQMQRIDADTSLTPEQQAQQIQALREEGFTAQEQKRLDVFLRNPKLLSAGQ